MDWQNLLLTFDGRINRSKYWTGVGISIALIMIGFVFIGLLPILGVVIALVAFLAAAFVGIPIGIKRLHDRNKSGHWLFLFYLVPGLLNSLGGASGSWMHVSGLRGMSGSLMFSGLVDLVALAVTVWSLVELGMLRGTDGPNQYGPNPLPMGSWRTA
jgi:uncharacterized membrane protein YhaH (DUF805 family)